MSKVFPQIITKEIRNKNYDIYFFTNATNWNQVSNTTPVTIRFGYGEISDDDKSTYLQNPSSADIFKRITSPSEANHNAIKVTNLLDCSIGQEATAVGLLLYNHLLYIHAPSHNGANFF